MMDAFDEFGVGERTRGGKREEKIFGMRWPGDYYRKPYGPGWALVGDAGFLKDPILRLPAGNWGVEASAEFFGEGCNLPQIKLMTRVPIVVTE